MSEIPGFQYVIVWEFRVAAKSAEEFERLYGPDGVWVRFFHTAQGFVRTELIRDHDQQGRYLTLDFWSSRDSYEAFRHCHASEYAAIDRQCEKVTMSEVEVGRFERIGAN